MSKTQISIRDLAIIYSIVSEKEQQMYWNICNPCLWNESKLTDKEIQRRLQESTGYQDVLRIKDALGQMQIEIETPDIEVEDAE